MKVVVDNREPPPKKKDLLPIDGSSTATELTKYNSKQFELFTEPSNGNAAKYKELFRILDRSEDLRTMIKWIQSLEELFTGTATDTLDGQKRLIKSLSTPAVYATFKRLLVENAAASAQVALNRARADDRNGVAIPAELQDAYDNAPAGVARAQVLVDIVAAQAARQQALANNGNDVNHQAVVAIVVPAAPPALTHVACIMALGEPYFMTTDLVKGCLVETIGTLLPRKILAKVKRQLRRDSRKPTNMKVRQYTAHLQRINSEELPLIPPGNHPGRIQSLGEDEILDILLWGTPKSWQKEMDRQGFDPLEQGIRETVDFMERMEETEDPPMQKVAKKPDKRSNKGLQKKPPGATAYCLLHGHGSHSTEECKALQKEAKRIKANHDSNSGGGKPPYKNKSWTKKADDRKKESQNEMNTLVKKAVAKGVRKELNAIAKAKRKADDDSSEEGELNALELDLSDFNYEDMENLKIDDEVSV